MRARCVGLLKIVYIIQLENLVHKFDRLMRTSNITRDVSFVQLQGVHLSKQGVSEKYVK